MNITSIECYPVLDSRGNPTLEGRVVFDDGRSVVASVPSGASVGHHEKAERRDSDGKSVSGVAVDVQCAARELLSANPIDFRFVDDELARKNNQWNQATLGANGTLLISLLAARCQALSQGVELFKLYATIMHCTLTKSNCLLIRANCIGGGRHADNKLAFQEFMVQSKKGCDIVFQQESIEKIYHALGQSLEDQGLGRAIGDEGAYAPIFPEIGFLAQEKASLVLLTKVIETCGLESQFGICLDVAASEFYDAEKGVYLLDGDTITSTELVGIYDELIQKYPIISIEDGMAQDDWSGWKLLTDMLGGAIELVGDDLFTTQCSRLSKGIDNSVANAILIKPNQVGSISETLAAIECAAVAGYGVIVSHRSGETTDTSIIDLAIGVGAHACKIGVPVQDERIAKYDRMGAINKIQCN